MSLIMCLLKGQLGNGAGRQQSRSRQNELNAQNEFCYVESEATQQRQVENCMRDAEIGITHAIVLNDTRDEFRLFNMLEHFMQSPPMLTKQMLLQIPTQVLELLIQK